MTTPNLVALFDGDPWVRVEIVNPPLVLDLGWVEHIASAAYVWLWDHETHRITDRMYPLPPEAELGAEVDRHGLDLVATWGPRSLVVDTVETL